MFQSTRPRGRTRPSATAALIPSMVSIHASSREDATRPDACAAASVLVSIHASSREDATQACSTDSISDCFNPRVLAGGRDRFFPRENRLARFQSTRPRGRTRLSIPAVEAAALCFNPRVLAGGRDCGLSDLNTDLVVSIHASSREDATRLRIALLCLSEFQSTRPRGRTRR